MLGKGDGELVTRRIVETEANLGITDQAAQPLLQILHVIINTMWTKGSVHQTEVPHVILAQVLTSWETGCQEACIK